MCKRPGCSTPADRRFRARSPWPRGWQTGPVTSSLPTGHRTQVVGAALLDDARRPTSFLAAQRAYPEALRGLWEFPGGKQEPRESCEEALVRECAEELGTRVELLAEVPGPHAQGWPLKDTAAMRVWTGVVADGAPAPVAGEDHLAVRWLPLAEPGAVLSLPWIPADLPIVRALLEQLRDRPRSRGQARAQRGPGTR
jgi:8-oxo-dGTP diphosphatase